MSLHAWWLFSRARLASRAKGRPQGPFSKEESPKVPLPSPC